MASKEKRALLLFLITLVAAFFRLYDLKNIPPGLYPDEAMNGSNALEAIETGSYKVFYPENNGREGLFINIQALFLKAIGLREPWVLRLPSAIFGIMTVLGVYFLTKKLFKSTNNESSTNIRIRKIETNLLFPDKAALLATFLIATSFWHINFSRIGFRAIMAPMFLTWSLYFLLLSLQKISFLQLPPSEKFKIQNSKFAINSNSQNLKSKKYSHVSDFGFYAYCLAILAGLLYGLGFYSYIAYRVTPLLIAFSFVSLLAFRIADRKTILKIGIIFSVAAIVAASPLIFYFFENPQDFFGRTAQISIFSSDTPWKDLAVNILKTAGMFNISGDWNWRHNIAGRPLLFWPVGILFIGGLIIATKSVGERALRRVSENSRANRVNKPGPASEREAGWRVASERAEFSELEASASEAIDLAAFFLLVWLIVAAIPLIVSNEGLPHALRAILMAPAVFILAGYGGVQIHEWLKTKKAQKRLIHVFYGLFFFVLILEGYYSYFLNWANRSEVAGAFAEDYVQTGRLLNSLPKEVPKYIVVEASGVNIRGFPMPAQTVMFLTDTFLPEKQREKNIRYLLPEKINEIPPGSFVVTIK